MNSNKTFWTSYFSENEEELKLKYPGISLQRFLMEVKDILSIDMNADHEMNLPLQDKFIEDLKMGKPFSYLLGFSEFYGEEYLVDKNVLIPRPETEYLVDIVVKEFQGKAKRVLDVGTGSGVILLSLLKNKVGLSGVGVDICQEALNVAAQNTKKLHLESKVELLISDRLDKVTGEFDLIVSNPPYIKATSHKEMVHQGVDEFEPHTALYLPDDYYNFWFEDFFASIREHLNGHFFMEGHELEVEGQAKILTRLGFTDVEVMKDLSGQNRYLRAQYALR